MGPIRGQTRPLPVAVDIAHETRHINAKMNASIHNRFDIEVIDAKTGEVRQRAQAENVICAGLWNVYTTAWNKCIVYGSGSGTPASTDTALFAYIGGASSNLVSSKRANLVYTVQKKITISETTAVGATLTELGIATATSGTTLCTHAMLQDMNGNQISLVKTATDIINIYATIYVHMPDDFKTWIGFGYIDLGQPEMLAVLSGTASLAINTFATGIDSISSSNNYNAATRTLTITAARAGASKWNVDGGVTNIWLSDSYHNQTVLIQTLLKSTFGTDISSEAIGTGDGSTTDYKTAFGYVSGTPTIYVDGVPASGVTVDFMTPKAAADHALFKVDSYGCIFSQYSYNSGYREWPNIFYNPLHDTLKTLSVDNNSGNNTTSIDYGSISVAASNDLENWVELTANYRGTFAIPEAYQRYKYFKINNVVVAEYGPYLKFASDCKGANIHFATAPASGAVITADYHTSVIAKDANHVLDLAVTIQFGEHTT